jgi:sugar phosphate isomerase/epimerase
VQLVLAKSLWGMPGPLEADLARVAAAGYDAVEAPLPGPERREAFRRRLQEHGLSYIAQVFTQGADGEAAAAHAASFSSQLRQAAELEPLLVVSHTGRDDMGFEEQRRLFEACLETEDEVGVRVGHETHRGRVLFTPWATARLLGELPGLKLTADFSHWVCVCESLLEDRGDALLQACQRAVHIHGRVGYPEGPQVPDPRSPESHAALEAHERWWTMIIKDRRREDTPRLTFTPEFGPPDYMHTLPFTRQPVADLWDVCYWMAERFRERFRHALTN